MTVSNFKTLKLLQRVISEHCVCDEFILYVNKEGFYWLMLLRQPINKKKHFYSIIYIFLICEMVNKI